MHTALNIRMTPCTVQLQQILTPHRRALYPDEDTNIFCPKEITPKCLMHINTFVNCGFRHVFISAFFSLEHRHPGKEKKQKTSNVNGTQLTHEGVCTL